MTLSVLIFCNYLKYINNSDECPDIKRCICGTEYTHTHKNNVMNRIAQRSYLPPKVQTGPGSWSFALFTLNWLGMSRERSEEEK